MQGHEHQNVTGNDMDFALIFFGDLDSLGVWIQQFD